MRKRRPRGEKLEIVFPSDDEKAVSKAMERVLVSGGDTPSS